LFTKFQTSFYADPVDAVFKVLGVDWKDSPNWSPINDGGLTSLLIIPKH
jgi:hypothetical protein